MCVLSRAHESGLWPWGFDAYPSRRQRSNPFSGSELFCYETENAAGDVGDEAEAEGEHGGVEGCVRKDYPFLGEGQAICEWKILDQVLVLEDLVVQLSQIEDFSLSSRFAEHRRLLDPEISGFRISRKNSVYFVSAEVDMHPRVTGRDIDFTQVAPRVMEFSHASCWLYP